MPHILNDAAVESKIITLRGQKVIIDSDVAALYDVETREINQAVKNNPEKFPDGYVIELDKNEWLGLKSKILISIPKGGRVTPPKAFTERGLYMLATILKGVKATETTLRIIDTFTKVREVGQIVSHLPTVQDNEPEYQKLMHRAGELISDLIVPEELDFHETESSIEFNLALVKFKYSTKKKMKRGS